MNDAAITATAMAIAGAISAGITSMFRRPQNRANAVESLTQAAVNMVEQLRRDNKELREDLERLQKIVEDQQAEIERCEERFQRLALKLADAGIVVDPDEA